MNTNQSAGRSIKIFLTDGTPNGLLCAEIMNWVGHVLVVPRSKIKDFSNREESNRTCIYFLSGEDPSGSSKTAVYIGESDDAIKRLRRHDQTKDFWNKAYIITSKDVHLTKSHVRYLESRLIQISKEANRCVILNDTNPDGLKLPEADKSDMEYFISQIQLILPVLSLNVLQPNISKRIQEENINNSPVFTIESSGIKASMMEVDGEFIVLSGSHAKKTHAKSFNKKKHLDELINEGNISERETHYEFVQDTAFNSLSTPASIIMGNTNNGWNTWKLNGKSYKEWHADNAS